MVRRRAIRASLPFVLLGVALAIAVPAMATTVNGTLTITPDLVREAETLAKERAGPLKQYFWRVPNGAIPTAEKALNPAQDLSVVLEPAGGEATAPAGDRRDMHLKGASLEPSVLAITPRTKVRFRNDDPFIYELRCDENESMAAVPPLARGQAVEISFDAPGIYEIRDRRMPHLRGHVVVVPTPLIASPQPAESGGGASFSFADVQPGSYLAKVFFDGRWVAQQEVTVTEGQNEVPVLIRLPSDEQQHEQASAPGEASGPGGEGAQ